MNREDRHREEGLGKEMEGEPWLIGALAVKT